MLRLAKLGTAFTPGERREFLDGLGWPDPEPRSDVERLTMVYERIVIPQLEARARKDLAEVWGMFLETMLDDRLDDGTPVLQLVFARNPELGQRLKEALT